MRPMIEIRADILEASRNYHAVSDIAWAIMPDANHDLPGTDEVLNSFKTLLRDLYVELAEREQGYREN